MPKYIVKEGILDKFLGKIFGAIASGKGKKLAKSLQFDPILQGHIKDANNAAEKVRKHIAINRKKDPGLDKYLKQRGL
jgi:hypothetical protein